MRMITIIAAVLLAIALLAGCGTKAPGSKPDSAAPSSQPSQSASQSESMDTQPVQPGRTLTDALSGTVSYGKDTAGVTLNNVTAATGLMDWFNSPDRDPLADPRAELEQWYNNLDEDSRQRFAENWPGIRDQAKSILDDPEGSKGLLDSAGVKGEYGTMASGWDSFVDSVNGFLDEVAQKTRRMMR